MEDCKAGDNEAEERTASDEEESGSEGSEAESSENQEASEASEAEDLVYSYILGKLQTESKTEPEENYPSDGDTQPEEEEEVASKESAASSRKRNLQPGKRDKRSKALRTSSRTRMTRKMAGGKRFDNTPCGCRKQCSVMIEEQVRRKMFEKFWKISSMNGQNAYLCNLIKQQGAPQRRRGRFVLHHQRVTTNQYYVDVGSSSLNVCKKYFLTTFQVTDSRVTKALKKKSQNGGQGFEVRKAPPYKTEEDKLAVLKQHIASFPSYQTAYTKALNPNRRYLSPQLNKALMYKLYREYCEEFDLLPLSEPTYRQTFAKEFTLYFGFPKSDICATCEQFECKMKANEDRVKVVLLKSDQDLHLLNAEFAKTAIKTDRELSEADSSVFAFTFDLPKPLPFPALSCSLVHYKRSMHVYSCGCHDLTKGTSSMYVWDETVASRGAQEISSCITRFLRDNAEMHRHIIMYSASSPDHFRNVKLALACMRLMQEDNAIELVDHKLMTPGHSYLPAESNFESVGLLAKRKNKFVPADWYSDIRKSRKNRAFTVYEMTRTDFRSTNILEELVSNVTKNEANSPISWSSIQWLRYMRDGMFKLYYKETLQEDVPFCCIDLKPVGVPLDMSYKDVELRLLNKRVRSVAIEKKKDMEDLLHYIPEVNHKYFNSLKTKKDVDDIGHLDVIEVFSKEDIVSV